MPKLSAQILSLFVVSGLIYSGVFSIGQTIAYYFDEEISKDNIFIATSLDFEIVHGSDVPYRTQTPGGWGAPAHGDNPGAYRDANFSSAFPGGLTIGTSTDGGFTALFTSASAIEQFLPAGGTAGPFTQNHVDHATTEAGVLAGHATALSLSVGFDYYDPNFGLNSGDLADYVMGGPSPCNGMTVGVVLNEANRVLAGLVSVFSPDDMTTCLTEINEKFVDGLGGGYVYEATVFNTGALGFQYTVTAENFSDPLCEQLTLDAKLDDITRYVGLLGNFYLTPPALFSDPEDNWEFAVGGHDSLGVTSELVCGFDLAFRGWQDNLPEFSGFRDEEIMHGEITVTTPTPTPLQSIPPTNVVLNEFLPNPEGKDHLDEPFGEWVELYNNGDTQVDLTGWYVWDGSGAEGQKISITGVIEPKGWFVVYMNKAVLNNDGDTVNLYNNSDVLVDSYTYTGIAPEGKSYARIPDGVGNWVDPVPTPGGMNILEPIEFELISSVSTPMMFVDEEVAEEVAEPEPVAEEDVVTEEESTPVVEEFVEEITEPEPVTEEISGETMETTIGEELALIIIEEPAVINEVDLVVVTEENEENNE